MKEELYKLLMNPLSKQIFAFEEVVIDYNKYIIWVEYIYASDCLSSIQEEIYPLLKYIGNGSEKINYWDLKSNLRSSMNNLGVEAPVGADAIKLYLYGYLQEKLMIINSCSSSQLYDIVLHMYELLREYDKIESFYPFLKIADKQIYNDYIPYYTELEKRNDLINCINKYISNHNIDILNQQGRYYIKINNHKS